MNLTTYINLATRTAKPLATPLDDLEHAYIGMVTELGEIATSIKRALIYGKGFTPEILMNLREEIGDLLWYCALAMRACAVPAELTDKVNMDELLVAGYKDDPSLRTTGIIQRILGLVEVIGRLVLGENTRSATALIICNLAMLAARFGFSMAEIAEENIAKLRLRFPDAYSDEAAEGRADKGGLPATAS